MQTAPRFAAPWFGPALVALAVWGAVIATLDPAGNFPDCPAGPGITVDEMFNVEQGFYLVEACRIYGLGLLDPQSLHEVFGEHSEYNPDHPPLGRLWLGLHHHIARWLSPAATVRETGGAVTACARTGSASAFALTVWLIGWFTASRHGWRAGLLASLWLALMPRLWGHAHLASLESITNLTWTAAVLAAAWSWRGGGGPIGVSKQVSAKDQKNGKLESPPTVWASALAGAFLGLAFLTKIQAILLPIPLAAWCLWRWRAAAVKPLVCWGLAAALVFFLGWPWLWLDPVGHARSYFGSTTQRASLAVWYFGQHYFDKAVPWHFPWVVFLTSIPVGTLLFGCGGAFWGGPKSGTVDSTTQVEPTNATTRGETRLLLSVILFSLLVFSLPGVAVYDNERLFLTVFPLWAMLAGQFASRCCEQWSRQRVGAVLVAGCLAMNLYQMVALHPCALSYYNVFAGGTAGAERLGLETTYWGDSITRELLQRLESQIPPGTEVHVAPVLHQFQLDDLMNQSPILRRSHIRLVPYEKLDFTVDYVLIYRRRADLPRELREVPASATLLAEVRRGGAQLAAIYAFRSPTTQ